MLNKRNSDNGIKLEYDTYLYCGLHGLYSRSSFVSHVLFLVFFYEILTALAKLTIHVWGQSCLLILIAVHNFDCLYHLVLIKSPFYFQLEGIYSSHYPQFVAIHGDVKLHVLFRWDPALSSGREKTAGRVRLEPLQLANLQRI